MEGAARPDIGEVLGKGEDRDGDGARVHQHPAILSTHKSGCNCEVVAMLIGYAPGTLAGVAGGGNRRDLGMTCLNTDWPPVTRI